MEASIALYDGQCPFCTREAKRLQRIVGGRVQAVDLHTPGVLERHSIAKQDAMDAMHLVTPEGKIYRGAEAIARALAKLPGIGLLAWGYYLPGIRQLADRGYKRVAAMRYRLWGKQQSAAGGCDSGACELHFGPKKR